jgi:hypothetical protein
LGVLGDGHTYAGAMRKVQLVALAAVAGALLTPASAAAKLRSPRLAGPANYVSVQELPAVNWQAVRGAAQYEYQISGDQKFRSVVGSGRTHNLSAALSKLQPDGTYWWRVRAVSAKGAVSGWSPARAIVKNWSAAPQILGGDGVSISWPATPLVLSWSRVPYANKYIVTIATDPALSNQVLGSVSQPVYTQGNSYAFPTTLAGGTYYWAVTPVDSEGHRGVRARVGSFNWNWPTATNTSFSNLSPDARVFDPYFSWNPVPGAARYDVEINQSPTFAAGSKWCCSTPTVGTSLAPQQDLGNNSTYWWRVRAVDANGNAGQWNDGQAFKKAFDAVPGQATIPNLTMRDSSGQPLTGVPVSTDTPLVTWDPVPGASRYELQLGVWNGSYCDFSLGTQYHVETATTAWTPLGKPGLSKPGPTAWPRAQTDFIPPTPGGTYCVRVLARADDDAHQQQVVSDWTYINGNAEPDGSPGPAFSYAAQPSTVSQTFAQYVQTGQYKLPAGGSSTTRTPYFTWNWLPGAKSYWVVLARDPLFTDVVDLGFTDVPAYAPRLANGAPLADKSTAYYWAVIPAPSLDGSGFGDDRPTQDQPQTFNKASLPPTLLQPADGATVSTWPTFRWSAAENARNYLLQVSQDPSFGKLLDNVTTDATAYTSSSTYPADTLLYWRVRGNDWTGQGLNWSPVQTFVRHLPGAAPLPGNPIGGDGLPVESWTGVPGAIAYDVHVDQGNGISNDYTVDSTAFAASERHGIGIIRWQVRPLFPTTTSVTVGGPFFAPQPYNLTLSAPAGAQGFKSGSRLVIGWRPDPAAKQYEVDVSNSQSFSSIISTQRVDGPAWAPDINWSLPSNRGRLYWRVAAVDTYGTVGSFASGSFLNGQPPAKHHNKHKKRHRRHK